MTPTMLESTRRRNAGFTLLEVAVETRVLHGHRRRRSNQLKNGHSRRGERVRCKAVFEVQHPEQPRLFEQWEAEHRPCAVLANILVGRKWILTGCVVQENTFFGPQHILKNRTGKIRGSDACLSQDDRSPDRGWLWLPLRCDRPRPAEESADLYHRLRAQVLCA